MEVQQIVNYIDKNFIYKTVQQKWQICGNLG